MKRTASKLVALTIAVIMLTALLAQTTVFAADERDGLIGEWVGTYNITSYGFTNMGTNGLKLSVFLEGADYQAIVVFFPVEGSSIFQKTGSYNADVQIDESTGDILVTGTTWIDRPGSFQFIGLSGSISDDTYSGEIYSERGDPSGFFTVSRVGEPHPPGIANPHSPWAFDRLVTAFELDLVPAAFLDPSVDLTAPITRAEFAAVGVKVYEALSGFTAIPAVINPFTDTNDIEVLKAYNIRIVTGTSATTYTPDRVLNREEAAHLLTNVFKRVTMPGWTSDTNEQFPLVYDKPAPFNDDAAISSWARDSVYFMVANGIITGNPGYVFAPRNETPAQEALGYADATREAALLIAVGMVERIK